MADITLQRTQPVLGAALRKVRTARMSTMDTGVTGKLSQPGGPLYTIGVSGSTVENDHAAGAHAV